MVDQFLRHNGLETGVLRLTFGASGLSSLLVAIWISPGCVMCAPNLDWIGYSYCDEPDKGERDEVGGHELERREGIEPIVLSLEDCSSAIELTPRAARGVSPARLEQITAP